MPHTGRVIQFHYATRPGAGRWEEISGDVESLTGYTPEELQRRTAAQQVHPDDLPLIAAMARDMNVQVRSVTLRWRHRDGRWVWLRQWQRPEFDAQGRTIALVGEARPAAEIRLPGQAADEVDERLLALASPRDVITMLTLDGEVLYESESVREIMGRPPLTGQGVNAFTQIHPDDVALAQEHLATLFGGGELVEPVRIRVAHPTDDWRLFDLMARIVGEGPAARLVLHARDVTDDDRARARLLYQREEMARLAESRAELIAELNEAERRRADLVRFLVHDLKGPLTTIIASADLARLDGPGDADELDETLATISEAGHRVNAMARELLQASRSHRGELEPQLAPIDLERLLATSRRLFLARNAGAKDRLRLEVDAELPTVRADWGLMLRVLENLLDNARKYADAEAPIALEARRLDACVLVAVRDRGPGIPEHAHEGVFAAGQRLARDADHAAAESFGLGLGFVARAVAAHDGRAYIDRDYRDGARICVELPVPQSVR